MHHFNYPSIYCGQFRGCHAGKDSTPVYFKSHSVFKRKSNKNKTKKLFTFLLFQKNSLKRKIKSDWNGIIFNAE